MNPSDLSQFLYKKKNNLTVETFLNVNDTGRTVVHSQTSQGRLDLENYDSLKYPYAMYKTKNETGNSLEEYTYFTNQPNQGMATLLPENVDFGYDYAMYKKKADSSIENYDNELQHNVNLPMYAKDKNPGRGVL